MEESYAESLASHGGPESCAIGRKADGEALTSAESWRESAVRNVADN